MDSEFSSQFCSVMNKVNNLKNLNRYRKSELQEDIFNTLSETSSLRDNHSETASRINSNGHIPPYTPVLNNNLCISKAKPISENSTKQMELSSKSDALNSMITVPENKNNGPSTLHSEDSVNPNIISNKINDSTKVGPVEQYYRITHQKSIVKQYSSSSIDFNIEEQSESTLCNQYIRPSPLKSSSFKNIDANLADPPSSIPPPAAAVDIAPVESSPFDEIDKSPSTTNESNVATSAGTSRGIISYFTKKLYGETDDVSTIVRSEQERKRIFLRYQAQPIGEKWQAVISLQQPKLADHKGPQGNRVDVISISVCDTKEHAIRLCQANVPPLWSGGDDPMVCNTCLLPSALLRKIHHCRNCGQYVCSQCSSKSWLSTMVPATYHNKERIIRVCDYCNDLMEEFSEALRVGDIHTAFTAFRSGNVNLYCPYKDGNFPVHCAALGGNLELMQWLIGPNMACIRTPSGAPLLNAKGQSVLAAAASCGNLEIMRLLTSKFGMLVSDITNIEDLMRGLHAALEAPGPLPLLQQNKNWLPFTKRNSSTTIMTIQSSPQFILSENLLHDTTTTTVEEPSVRSIQCHSVTGGGSLGATAACITDNETSDYSENIISSLDDEEEEVEEEDGDGGRHRRHEYYHNKLNGGCESAGNSGKSSHSTRSQAPPSRTNIPSVEKGMALRTANDTTTTTTSVIPTSHNKNIQNEISTTNSAQSVISDLTPYTDSDLEYSERGKYRNNTTSNDVRTVTRPSIDKYTTITENNNSISNSNSRRNSAINDGRMNGTNASNKMVTTLEIKSTSNELNNLLKVNSNSSMTSKDATFTTSSNNHRYRSVSRGKYVPEGNSSGDGDINNNNSNSNNNNTARNSPMRQRTLVEEGDKVITVTHSTSHRLRPEVSISPELMKGSGSGGNRNHMPNNLQPSKCDTNSHGINYQKKIEGSTDLNHTEHSSLLTKQKQQQQDPPPPLSPRLYQYPQHPASVGRVSHRQQQQQLDESHPDRPVTIPNKPTSTYFNNNNNNNNNSNIPKNNRISVYAVRHDHTKRQNRQQQEQPQERSYPTSIASLPLPLPLPPSPPIVNTTTEEVHKTSQYEPPDRIPKIYKNNDTRNESTTNTTTTTIIPSLPHQNKHDISSPSSPYSATMGNPAIFVMTDDLPEDKNDIVSNNVLFLTEATDSIMAMEIEDLRASDNQEMREILARSKQFNNH